jgi:CheY-like chemotaxis protein
MASLKVIVVDDNHTNRLLPGLFLRPLGYTVDECDSAAQTWSLLQHTACDVLLLDISMFLMGLMLSVDDTRIIVETLL